MNAISPMAIEVQHLSRRFGRSEALRDVSLTVPVGGVYGLVGLNGAGKTTLIRHLIGGLRAHQGSVRIFGDDPVSDPVAVLQRIGYLTEEDSLPRWLTVAQLVDYGRSVYPRWDDEYAESLCEQFQLLPSDRLGALSKGARARAGLLAAIAHHPDLLILDEPSSGLDPIARRDILEAIIAGVSHEGRTVLFSSHLLDEVARVCDTVGVMHDGQLQPSVTLDEIQSEFGHWIIQGQTRPLIDGAINVQGARRQPAMDQAPADGQGAGGIQEWSVVGPLSLEDDSGFPIERVIERRPMTLECYFAARVNSSASSDVAEAATEVSS